MLGRNYKGVFSKMGEGLLEKYAQDIQKELETKPDDPELLFKLGIAYTRMGKIDDAREIYKRLKDIDESKAKELLDAIYDV